MVISRKVYHNPVHEPLTCARINSMNIFSNIFAYLELAAGGVAAVVTIEHLVQGPTPITGAEIVSTISPVLSGIQTIFPKLVIPTQLVTDISDGAADAINAYYKKGAVEVRISGSAAGSTAVK